MRHETFYRRRSRQNGKAYLSCCGKQYWLDAGDSPHYRWLKADHLRRRRNFVLARSPRLVCQECGGKGEYLSCGFCEGVGYVTPHERGWWLRQQKWIRIATE